MFAASAGIRAKEKILFNFCGHIGRKSPVRTAYRLRQTGLCCVVVRGRLCGSKPSKRYAVRVAPIQKEETIMRYQVLYLQRPEGLERAMNSGNGLDGVNKLYLDVSMGGFRHRDEFAKNIAQAAKFGLYKLVVELDAADLEDVFYKCNSIDRYWATELPENANFPDGTRDGYRSMSVGDLVKDEDGKVFAVASFGFEQVTL